MLNLSLLYFFVKGITYLLIGSYAPILFVVSATILLYWSSTASSHIHRRALKYWAILIIIWATARFGIWLVFQIDTQLTESHIREQFGAIQHIISLLMLIIGLGVIRQVKQEQIP